MTVDNEFIHSCHHLRIFLIDVINIRRLHGDHGERNELKGQKDKRDDTCFRANAIGISPRSRD